MAKRITYTELSHLVAGLLVKPEVVGELDSREKHNQFAEDIARVVAAHCGGDVLGSDSGTGNVLAGDDKSPQVIVEPNESLPSLQRNAWASFDPHGWEESEYDQLNSQLGEQDWMTQEEVRTVRLGLISALLPEGIEIPFVLADQGRESNGSVRGAIAVDQVNVSLRFEGHTVDCCADDVGFPLAVELYDGELRAMMWTDINSEEPTETVWMSGARNKHRSKQTPNIRNRVTSTTSEVNPVRTDCGELSGADL